MKLQRTPVALMLAALLLGAIVYIRESDNSAQQKSTQTLTQQKLFPFKEDEIQTITIQTQAQTLAFTKTPTVATQPTSQPASQPTPKPTASSAPSKWIMTAPRQTAANDASIAYLLSLMATGSSEQTIVVSSNKQAEFGFDKPLATVEVKRLNQQTHRLILGKPNFNRSRLYAQVDPPTGTDLTVQLVSIDFESAVTRALPEWLK